MEITTRGVWTLIARHGIRRPLSAGMFGSARGDLARYSSAAQTPVTAGDETFLRIYLAVMTLLAWLIRVAGGVQRTHPSGLQRGHDGRGIPEGADHHDLSRGIAVDDIDALESDGFPAGRDTVACPFDGGGAAPHVDSVLDQADALEAAEYPGKEGPDRLVSHVRRSADGIVLFGIGCEDGHTPFYVHGTDGGEVFGDCLLGGRWHAPIVMPQGDGDFRYGPVAPAADICAACGRVSRTLRQPRLLWPEFAGQRDTKDLEFARKPRDPSPAAQDDSSLHLLGSAAERAKPFHRICATSVLPLAAPAGVAR